MRQVIGAAVVTVLLLTFLCGVAFPNEPGLKTEFRQQGNLHQAISRTIDPAAPGSAFFEAPGGAGVRGNPLDATGSLMWQTSDPTGMMNNVAIAGNGSVAAIAIDLNNQRLEVYDGVTGSVRYSIPAEGGGWGGVAISDAGDYVVYGTGNRIFLLPPDSSTPIWIADPGPGLAVTRVAISRDGQQILAMEGATAQDQDSLHVWSFAPGSSTPVWSRAFDYSSQQEFYGANYSADGSHLVITERNWLTVVDPEDGSLIWETPLYNTQYAAAVSGDGRVISYGSNNDGKIRVFHWDPGQQTYITLWTYTFTGGTSNWGTATAISANGETIAGGSLQFTSGGYDAFLAVFDTYGNGAPLWTPVSMSDLVGDVAISDDGITVAACSWGPMSGNSPADIQVFDKHSAVPFYTYSHPGSPNDLAITPDGTRLFAGGKATHNRQFGNGGYAYLFALDLEGGTVTGTVTLSTPGSFADVTVETQNGIRHTLTDDLGDYSLAHIPAGTYTIIAHKLGYTTGQVPNIVITDGGEVPNVDFALDTSDVAPNNLTASQSFVDHIQLNWAPVSLAALRQHEYDMRLAVGDEPYLDPLGPVALAGNHETDFRENPFLDRDIGSLDDADSIHVWRSAISGGPYARIVSLPGTATTFSDSLLGLRPGVNYYYAVTAVYPNAESEYSNEATGVLDDSYLNFSPVVPPMTTPVTFDGVFSPGEWSDAVSVDISDVLGYDGQDPPGTAFLYMKYDDDNDLLLVAAEDFANPTLDNDEGIGFYVDDDNSDTWTTSRPGSEGNYWAYWYPGGATLRYRSLTGGPYASNPYLFPNPQIGFSDASGHLTMEVAIPLGFHHVYDIALYGPDRTPGVGAFIIQRISGTAIFHGWWPQDIPSIVSNPEFFSETNINAQLYVPPLSPSDIQVQRSDAGIQVAWTDPTLGIDSLPLFHPLDGINIYRNGQFMDVVAPGVQLWSDQTPVWGGWYEYSLAGFIPEDSTSFEGPPSVPVGIFAGADPQITDLSYDDGEWDGFQIPAYPYDGNREAVKFQCPAWASRVYTVQLLCNTDGLIGIGVAANENSQPGTQLAGPYWVHPSVLLDYFTFHIPGTDPPVVQDTFWVTLDWQPDDVWNPGVGTDIDAPISGMSYYFTNQSGWVGVSQNFMVRTGVGDSPNGAEDPAPALVHQYRLLQNYPNPFNPSTRISFEIAQANLVQLKIFNLLGREVATLINEERPAGLYQVTWDGHDLRGAEAASGVYIFQLKAGDFVDSRKMLLLR